MIGHSHRIVTLSLSVAISVIAFQSIPMFNMTAGWTQPSITMAVFVLFFILGARAPDWLEFPQYVSSGHNGRVGVLYPFGHRTLTHWWLFWVAPLGLFLTGYFPWNMMTAALLGFSMSGLIHLLLDAMTVGGIPVLHPFGCAGDRRIRKSLLSCFSLRLMKTGQWVEFIYVGIISFSALFFAFYASFIDRGVIAFFGKILAHA